MESTEGKAKFMGAGPPRATRWVQYFTRGPHKSILMPDPESVDPFIFQQLRAGYREETALHDFYSVVFSSSIVEGRLSALKHVHYMLIDDGVFN